MYVLEEGELSQALAWVCRRNLRAFRSSTPQHNTNYRCRTRRIVAASSAVVLSLRSIALTYGDTFYSLNSGLAAGELTPTIRQLVVPRVAGRGRDLSSGRPALPPDCLLPPLAVLLLLVAALIYSVCAWILAFLFSSDPPPAARHAAQRQQSRTVTGHRRWLQQSTHKVARYSLSGTACGDCAELHPRHCTAPPLNSPARAV